MSTGEAPQPQDTRPRLLAVLLAAILALGVFPHDWTHTLNTAFDGGFDAYRTTIGALAVIGMSSPGVPFVLLLLAWLWPNRIPRILPPLLIVAAILLGPLLVLGSASLLPSGSATIRFYAALGVWASVIGAALLLPPVRRHVWMRAVGWAGLATGALVGAWSLSVVPQVILSANRVADGRPFCVNFHEQTRTIDSYADLRGVSFVAASTGHKDTSVWYFHAILLVRGAPGTLAEVWNWSHRTRRFEPLRRPELQIVPVMGVCTPAPDFWSTL